MPTSNLHVAPYVLEYVHSVQATLALKRPLRLLDVGPGRGKYGYLLREYVDPAMEVDALEAWVPYITDFALGAIYHNVLAGDILEASPTLLARYDVVLMADIIEHLDKGPALDLLDRLPGYVVVSTPRDFFHNPANLPPTETHRSHWTPDDFTINPRFIDLHAHVLDVYAGLLTLLGPK
jgi:2-polyprenyl-3-methyl-5-hydroxy-6-metoxy-1,4-benzoquinol methylase